MNFLNKTEKKKGMEEDKNRAYPRKKESSSAANYLLTQLREAATRGTGR